ncbi:MAG TPA: NAD(P)/FAD-dependent oxidoreductase [Beijerinckiaceae bacterium]|nr:NAD(P)/FAD-dependent oxidoreductase [Beijerinckiaceae bacterium]
MQDGELDCLIVGGGPAGLTAALYLARFERHFVVVDSGSPRAAWIPTSHNIPFFAEGISGRDILARQREHAERYGAHVVAGTVCGLQKLGAHFVAMVEDRDGGSRQIHAKRVLIATGSVDIEPDLPDVPNAVQRGLVRYCPICDGYEARDKKIAVIGYGDRGLGEALFVARTYSRDVTLLTLGQGMELDADERRRADEQGVKVVYEPVAALDVEGERITALRTGSGKEHRFEVLYSALGRKVRSDLAVALGAAHEEAGSLLVDDHRRTTVQGLYAAGGVACHLDQIVVAMSDAAIAATDIHNRCDLPVDNEPHA